MAENKETLKDKIKSLLNLSKVPPSRATPTAVTRDSVDWNELWLDICASSPVEGRVERIKEIMKISESEILEDSVIKKLWVETKDLLQPETAQELRSLELRFIRSIIKGQYRRLGIMRAVFFQALQQHSIPEDSEEVVKTFEMLTDSGKDVELFEQEFGPCLVNWLSTMKRSGILLSLLINVIKFNSSYLDQEVIIKMLKFVCHLCKSECEEQDRELGMQVVDAVICYSSLPHESLNSVTIMLCYTLNMKKFCSQSWKLMRKLLGTHLGHSCVVIMCSLLQNPRLLSDWPLFRSAVFYVGMGLWGSVRVKTLKHTPQSVLPSFRQALLTKNLELAFEVTLTIQRLVRKYGHELQAGTWDHVLDIVVSLLEIIEENMKSGVQSSALTSLQSGAHEIITFIEKLVESEVYDGSVDRLFGITERCVSDRPTESVFLLISYKLRAINPTKHNWIPSILLLVNMFYTKERRSVIRLKVVEVLTSVIDENMDLYEEELVNEVLVGSFKDVAIEKDVTVKTKCLELMFRACLLSKNEAPSLLHVIESVLSGDWTTKRFATSEKDDSKNFSDIKVIVSGLIEFFEERMCRYPGSDAIKAYGLIILFLRRFYFSSAHSLMVSDTLIECRKKIFSLLLSLRADEKGLLFINGKSKEHSVSSLVIIRQNNEDRDQDDWGYLPFDDALDCVLSCLTKETCWPVNECVLTGLNGLLQNKIILTGSYAESNANYPCIPYIDKLATTLCTLLSDADFGKKKAHSHQDATSKYAMQAAIISVTSSMICYHHWLDVTRQRQILRCLESGFISRCARLCVQTMTLCITEMPQDALLRLLPSVLLRLTQMSATVHLSTSVLDLLATLAQLPDLFTNFVEEQYKSIFAVALQYTNPSKFSRYVVSLAHFVIGTWFAKCRLCFRLEFVGFITRNLHTVNRTESTTNSNQAVETVRSNLMEACIDMMAQYTFSNGSIAPRRSPLAQFLFRNGPTATWLVGNKLVTVTTSSLQKLPEMAQSSSLLNNSSVSGQRFSTLQNKSSEAPAKLLSSSSTLIASSPRQRHKSGGAVLKRYSSLRSSEASSSHHSEETSRPLTNSNGASDGEQSAACLQEWLTSGWAEIYVRRPTGNTAWSMRIQNLLDPGNTFSENALNIHSLLNDLRITSLSDKKKSQKDDKEDPGKDFTTDLRDSSSGDINGLPDAKKRSNSSCDRPNMVEFPKKSRDIDILFPGDGLNYPSSPPSLPSAEPLIRVRSHTVSTSKDCDIETAAANAKLKAERRKYEQISKSGTEFTSNSAPRSASAMGMRGSLEEPLENNEDRANYMPFKKESAAITPSYVFLQLFQSAWRTESIHRPILLPTTPAIERSIQVLDMIPPYDTWATGVIYVGHGDGENKDAIIANEGGSPRYQEFLKGLGELVCLRDCDPSSTFLSGLDTKGEDGDFTYVWKEDVMQMVFHVTTLMPTRQDIAFKKRHIGNDYVIIAYDDDNGRYVPGSVVQGQFRSAEVVIKPLDNQTNHVRYVFHKALVEKAIGSDTGPWLISDKHLPVFVRQLALHASMAAFVCVGEGASSDEYSSKALARLKQIKRIRSRALQELERDSHASKRPENRSSQNETNFPSLEEFSDYVR